jgi:hypothetical protein
VKTLKLGRRLTLLLMLTLHATTSLFGPGHHAVDGLIGRVIGSDCTEAACETAGDVLCAPSDCAACDYFTIATLPTEQPPAVLTVPVQAAVVRLETIEVSRPRFAVSIPRAPPRAPA